MPREETRVELLADESLALLDWGRGKYHVPHPHADEGWTLCEMRLNGTPRIKFEDEVAPEDLCRRCLARVIRETPDA